MPIIQGLKGTKLVTQGYTPSLTVGNPVVIQGLKSGLLVTQGYTSSAHVFSPPDVANLVGWYKADSGAYSDAGVTLATNGQTVQQWNDQSGNGRHLVQPSAGSRPAYRASVLGDTGLITFSGSKALGQTNAVWANGATAVTIYAVVEENENGGVWSTGAFPNTTLTYDIFSRAMRAWYDGTTGYANTATGVHLAWLQRTSFDGSGGTDATRLRVWNNARPLSLIYNAAAVPSALGATTGFAVGTARDLWTGSLREVIVYNGIPSSGEDASISAYLRGRQSQGTRKYFTFTGDSITVGVGASTTGAYANLLRARLGTGYVVINQAIGGTSLRDHWIGTAAWYDQILYPTSTHPLDVELVHLGTNDPDDATLQTQLTSIWAKVRAGGRRVLACTVPGKPTASAWIRTQTSSWDALADFQGDARLGVVGSVANPTYYADSLHPNDSGNVVMADIVQAALAQIESRGSSSRNRGRFPLLGRFGFRP